jgi:hypothetical protein
MRRAMVYCQKGNPTVTENQSYSGPYIWLSIFVNPVFNVFLGQDVETPFGVTAVNYCHLLFFTCVGSVRYKEWVTQEFQYFRDVDCFWT